MNFLSNALKFTLHGRIALRIRECLNGGVEFEVQDSGVGIADRDIPMLFQMFGKLQARNDLNVNGCGIGLHVSKQIVQKLGGQIEVQSAVARGSSFSFMLPLEEDTEVINEESAVTLPCSPRPYFPKALRELTVQSKSSNSLVSRALGSRKGYWVDEIMLVDDSSMNLYVLENLLKAKLKLSSTSFSSGREAVTAVEQKLKEVGQEENKQELFTASQRF